MNFSRVSCKFGQSTNICSGYSGPERGGTAFLGRQELAQTVPGPPAVIILAGTQFRCHQNAAKLGQPHSSPNLSAEWSTGTVGPYGDTKQRNMTNVSKKKNQ